MEEVHHAKDEGVHFEMLVNPVEFFGDEKGNLTSVKCIRQELGEPDDSGRRSPVPIKGSEFVVPCDVAIIAAGTSANPLIQSTTPGLAVTKRGYISANDDLATSKLGVFAGGDIVTGGATVILAMGAGRKAAKSINEYSDGREAKRRSGAGGGPELTHLQVRAAARDWRSGDGQFLPLIRNGANEGARRHTASL